MEIEKIINTLHPLERKVLPVLDKINSLKEITEKTNLQEVEAMRAFQWLQNKGIIKIKEELKELVNLDFNGKKYLKEGLPEKRFLLAIKEKDLPIPAIIKKSNITKEEVNICLGVLKGKAAISIKKDKELIIAATEQGKKLLSKESLEELFLKREFPIDIKELKDEEKFALDSLRKRKNIVKIELKKLKMAELTNLGKKIIESGIKISDVTDRLTTDMLKTGSWKEKKFRRYDVKINVPSIFGGKKQHYRRFLDEVRQKFLALGFTEMTGPIVESNFWDMDALFMPQFHSARDIHSAYYIKEPKYSKLSQKLVNRVKQAHENGFNTGSKGWQYNFDIKLTHRNILRTHDTAISARTLASKLKIPGKYFQTVRCFRPDVIDASHNVEFNQTGGFVIEEGINFGHLKGLLKMFAEEFCQTDQIKIVPGYFPFTEPSAELHVKHPELGWIELAGSGIFRPEMVKPLVGREVPVIAWGVGLDRVAMFKLGIKDIRELFSHDLEFLRTVKVV